MKLREQGQVELAELQGALTVSKQEAAELADKMIAIEAEHREKVKELEQEVSWGLIYGLQKLV